MREIFLSLLLILSAISLTCAFDDDAECGKIKVEKPASDLNETTSYDGQWPWLASLFAKQENNFICGSTIITQWHLLTSAHCVISENFDDYYVLMGHFDLSNSTNSHEQRRDIQFIHTHENFNTTKNQKSTGDIAILKVSEAIDFNDFVQPICLPQPSIDVTNLVGYLSTSKLIHDDDKKNFIELKSINKWICLDRDINYGKIISEFSFCAESNDSSLCVADSGSGFYVYDKAAEKYTTYGILSNTIDNCNEYVVFVEVPKYIQWIHEAIKSEKDIDEFFTVSCDEINCGEQEECKIIDDIPECICQADYFGNPPNCIPKCIDNSKCSDDQACADEICIDLCLNSTCVENSQCSAVNHKIECKCNSGYVGNGLIKCEKYFIDGRLKNNTKHFGTFRQSKKYTTFFVAKKAKLNSMNAEIRPTHRNKNVEIIHFGFSYQNDDANFLPVKVSEIFDNLNAYQVFEASLKEINHENFKNLNKLEILEIENNRYELVIKENSFDDLRNLKLLELKHDHISELPGKLLENNYKLERVDLGHNELTSLSENVFENTIDLKELYLNHNQLSSLSENIFKNLKKLHKLILNNNQLKSLSEDTLKSLANLEVVNFNDNKLTTLAEKILIKNMKIEVISLNSNEITKLSNEIFKNKLNLKYVGLEGNVCINKNYGDYINPLTYDEKELLRIELDEKC